MPTRAPRRAEVARARRGPSPRALPASAMREAAERGDERGLAGAVGAEEREELAAARPRARRRERAAPRRSASRRRAPRPRAPAMLRPARRLDQVGHAVELGERERGSAGRFTNSSVLPRARAWRRHSSSSATAEESTAVMPAKSMVRRSGRSARAAYSALCREHVGQRLEGERARRARAPRRGGARRSLLRRGAAAAGAAGCAPASVFTSPSMPPFWIWSLKLPR